MYFNSLKFLIEDNNKENIDDVASVDDGLEKDAPATEPQIKQIKKILLNKINQFAKQKSKGSLDDDLGIFTLQNLNSLSRIPILGKMILDPMQTKGAQKKGTSSFDIMQYKKMQVIPFFLFNKDGENINASNSKEDYNLLFLVPVVGAKITPDNMEQHKVLFSKETSNGFKLKDYYETLPNIGYIADIKLTNDELLKTSTAFKTDNISAIKSPISKKSTRKSSGEQNPQESILRQNLSINEEKNIFNMKKENYRNNINMNDRIIKGKLSDLLFESNLLFETRLSHNNFDKWIKDEIISKDSFKKNLLADIAKGFKNFTGATEIQNVINYINDFIRDPNKHNQFPEFVELSKKKKTKKLEMLRKIKEVAEIAYQTKLRQEESSASIASGDDASTAENDVSEDQNNSTEVVEQNQESEISISAIKGYPSIIYGSRLVPEKLDEYLGLFGAIFKLLQKEDISGPMTFKKMYNKLSNLTHPDKLDDHDKNLGNNAVNYFQFLTSLKDCIGTIRRDSVNTYEIVLIEGINEQNKTIEIKKYLVEKYYKKLLDPNVDVIDVSSGAFVRSKESSSDGVNEEVFKFFKGVFQNITDAISKMSKKELDEFMKSNDENSYVGVLRLIQNLSTTTLSEYKEQLSEIFRNINNVIIVRDNELNPEESDKIKKDINTELVAINQGKTEQMSKEEIAMSINSLGREFGIKIPTQIEDTLKLSDQSEKDLTQGLSSGTSTTKANPDSDESSTDKNVESGYESVSRPAGVKEKEVGSDFKLEKVLFNQISSNLSNVYKSSKFKQKLSSIELNFDSLPKNIRSMLRILFATNESVYLGGIKQLINEEEASESKEAKLTSIDINDVFSELQQSFEASFDGNFKMSDIVINTSSTETPKELREKIGRVIKLSETRFKDGLKQLTDDSYTFDFGFDFSKECAYALCEKLIEEKEKLGIEIKGTLPSLDDISLRSVGTLFSDRIYDKARSQLGDDYNEEQFKEKLNNALKEVVEDICVNFTLKYDEDIKASINEKIAKQRDVDKLSTDDYRKIKRGRSKKFASALGGGAGAIGGIGAAWALGALTAGPAGWALAAGSAAGAAIGHKFGAEKETFTSRRAEVLKESSVKEQIKKLNELIKSLARDVKQMYGESKLINGNLSNLLFESNLLLEANKKLTYDDVKKKLKTNQILVFGFPQVADRNTAAAELTEAVCGLLEDIFDIEISGVSDAQSALALSRIGAAIDENAKAGEVASEEIAIETSDAGVPPNLNANMSSAQLLNLLNQTGGDNFLQILILFLTQKDKMTQLFTSMDEGNVTGREAVKAVNNASGGKMSELESSLSTAIKSSRISLPEISKVRARKIILTLRDKDNQTKILSLLNKDISNDKKHSFVENNQISKLIIEKFNITSQSKKLTGDAIKNLVELNLLTVNGDITDKVKLSFGLILSGILENKIITSENVGELKATLSISGDDDVSVDVNGINNILRSLSIKLKESRVSNDLFVGSLKNYLFEGSEHSSTQKRKVNYNNPKYLEAELKRIWKI